MWSFPPGDANTPRHAGMLVRESSEVRKKFFRALCDTNSTTNDHLNNTYSQLPHHYRNVRRITLVRFTRSSTDSRLQHASHVRPRPPGPVEAHLHAQKGHRRRSQQERASGQVLTRRQVLEAQGHDQEEIWTAFDAAE